MRSYLFSILLCGVENECLPPEAGPQCGNGDCEMGEGQLNCPEDCGEPPPAYKCIIDHCEVGQCPNYNGCNNVLLCLSACESSQCTADCLDDGPNHIAGFLMGVVECATDSGCMPKQAGLEDAECGDGKCDPDEDPLSCFEDCKAGPEDCGNELCDIGESFESCPEDCKADGSCKFNCGKSTGAETCHCHSGCAELGTCCGDYVSLCDAGDACGDESCDGAETADNCPGDCAGPGWGCLLDECEAAEGCAGASYCGVALVCIAQCNDVACTEACLEGQPTGNLGFLNEIISCAESKECFVAPSAVCGDGTCAESESIGGCPADCAGPSWSCLLEKCEALACSESETCAPVLVCVSQCDDTPCGEACLVDVAEDGKAYLEAILACGAAEGCLAL